MVILDNFQVGEPHHRYERDTFAWELAKLNLKWPPDVAQPTTLLLSPGECGCVLHAFEGLQSK